MAVISFAETTSGGNLTVVTWADMATDDTGNPFEPQGTQGIVGCVQATGTFANGTSVALQGSNDGSNWFALPDTDGATIALTSAGGKDFSTAARYIRPAPTSGSSDSVTVTVCLRG